MKNKKKVEASPRRPDESGMLQMVPLDGGGDEEEDFGGELNAQPKSATQFFAIPKAKKKKPEPPKAPTPGLPGGAATPGVPMAAAAHGAGMLPPPGGSLPPSGGGFGIQAPGASMPPIGGPMAGGPIGISGPIASGPVPAGSQGGPQSPFQVGQMPDQGIQDPENRARSFRVYAIILALFFMVFMAVGVAVVAVVLGLNSAGSTTAASDEGSRVEAPAEKPKKEKKPKGDTAAPPAEAAPPPPKRSSSSSSSGKSSSSSASSGSSASSAAPVRASSSPGTVTVKVPEGQSFTGVEVKCPSGFAQRGAFSGSTATVKNVPNEDCEIFFKGGLPAKYRPVRPGRTFDCSFQGSVAICK